MFSLYFVENAITFGFGLWLLLYPKMQQDAAPKVNLKFVDKIGAVLLALACLHYLFGLISSGDRFHFGIWSLVSGLVMLASCISIAFYLNGKFTKDTPFRIVHGIGLLVISNFSLLYFIFDIFSGYFSFMFLIDMIKWILIKLVVYVVLLGIGYLLYAKINGTSSTDEFDIHDLKKGP
ncbi:MAG: hypothetical protein MRY83_20645 [Flavobacteriales bacterium]|nr:hypothetical protein [Flavobacteriales bacterium]